MLMATTRTLELVAGLTLGGAGGALTTDAGDTLTTDAGDTLTTDDGGGDTITARHLLTVTVEG